MDLILKLHIFAVAFWLGVVGVEFILENSRAQSRNQGYAVAQYHFRIDMFLEMPAFTLVLVTGLMMLDPARLSGIYLLKIATGMIAVIGNVLCLVPIVLRKLAADDENLIQVVAYSRMVDWISAVAVPAGLAALVCGMTLAFQ